MNNSQYYLFMILTYQQLSCQFIYRLFLRYDWSKRHKYSEIDFILLLLIFYYLFYEPTFYILMRKFKESLIFNYLREIKQ
jgi:hypothetical protein